MGKGKVLTEKEIERIRILAGVGMKTTQIAEFMGLGRSTVYGVVTDKRDGYNEQSRKVKAAIRHPEQALMQAQEQLRMETPETPRSMPGDPHHVLMAAGIRPEDLAAAIRDNVKDALAAVIRDEKKNAWGMVYSAMLQAIRDAKKGGQADAEEAGA